MKEIKCKKCHLTYSSNNKQCPYCKTKKPFNTGIIILMLLIIAVIVGVIGFVRPTKYIEGMKIEVIETTTSDSWLFNKTVNYKLDITNVSNHDITTDLYITAYADNYEMLSTSIFITDLLPSKKTSDTITVFVGEKEWNKLQIYYKTNEEDEYKPLYTTYRKDIETH